jgi:hypothetical protein
MEDVEYQYFRAFKFFHIVKISENELQHGDLKKDVIGYCVADAHLGLTPGDKFLVTMDWLLDGFYPISSEEGERYEKLNRI